MFLLQGVTMLCLAFGFGIFSLPSAEASRCEAVREFIQALINVVSRMELPKDSQTYIDKVLNMCETDKFIPVGQMMCEAVFTVVNSSASMAKSKADMCKDMSPIYAEREKYLLIDCGWTQDDVDNMVSDTEALDMCVGYRMNARELIASTYVWKFKESNINDDIEDEMEKVEPDKRSMFQIRRRLVRDCATVGMQFEAAQLAHSKATPHPFLKAHNELNEEGIPKVKEFWKQTHILLIVIIGLLFLIVILLCLIWRRQKAYCNRCCKSSANRTSKKRDKDAESGPESANDEAEEDGCTPDSKNNTAKEYEKLPTDETRPAGGESLSKL